MTKFFLFFIITFIAFNCSAKDFIENNSYVPKMRKIVFNKDAQIAIEKSEKEIVKEYLLNQKETELIAKLYLEGSNVIFSADKVYICDGKNQYQNLFVINSKELSNALSENAFKFTHSKHNNTRSVFCKEKIIEILVTIVLEKVVDGVITVVTEMVTEYHTIVECTPGSDLDHDNTSGSIDDGLGADYGGGLEPGNFEPGNLDNTGGFTGSGSVHKNYRIIY